MNWNLSQIRVAELKILQIFDKFLSLESKFDIFAQSGGLNNWIMLQLGI